MIASCKYTGVPHFFSVFFACLYQKYFSEKIEQLFAVFFGTDEHADIIKNEIKTINFFDRITN